MIELSNDNAAVIINKGEGSPDKVAILTRIEDINKNGGVYLGEPPVTPEKRTLTAQGEKNPTYMILGLALIGGLAAGAVFLASTMLKK